MAGVDQNDDFPNSLMAKAVRDGTSRMVSADIQGGGGGGVPGGSPGQLQFNSAGVFGGVPSATYDGTRVSLVGADLGTPFAINLANATNVPAAGSNGQLQFNNAGVFGGVTGWSTNGSTALTGGAGTTLVVGNATLGANTAAIGGNFSVSGVISGANTAVIAGAIRGSTNATVFSLGAASDVVLSRAGAAGLQFGAADAAAPIAQTIGPQNVATGTADTGGPVFTFFDSGSTGAAFSGGWRWQSTLAGASGSAKNPRTNAMTLDPFGNVTFSGNLAATGLAAPTLNVNNGTLGANVAIFNGSVALQGSASLTVPNGVVNASQFRAPNNTNAAYVIGASNDTMLTRKAANVWQFGQPDSAAPAAQGFVFQGGLGSNIATPNATIGGPASTGTGLSGDTIFTTGGTGAGTAVQNAQVESFRVKGATQTLQIALGKALQLGNAFVPGVVAATGTLTVQDSTGATYRLLCLP